MKREILNNFKEKKAAQKKSLAVLLDPDKINWNTLPDFIYDCQFAQIDYFFVGGSLISNYQLSQVINQIKSHCNIPVVLFPGHSLHVVPEADGILLLSLISGRNAEYLIGHHVAAAPLIKEAKLEVLPTGYMLVDGGLPTTASYISNTTPLPANKPEIAACTAMAGELLGLQLMYLDAGSGAQNNVNEATIKVVSKNISVPLIVGGGINTAQKAKAAWLAGADLIVVGNKLENNPEFLTEVVTLRNEMNVNKELV